MNANDALTAVDYDPFAASPELAAAVPSTEAQREIWLACQLGGDATLAYNESVTLHLRGAVDLTAIVAAVQSLPARHDALRATFSADGEQMLIAETLALDVPIDDLRMQPAAAREQMLAAAADAAVRTPFDLQHGPLLRARLLRLADDHVALLLTAHHIVCDGWSFGVLVNDIAALYAGKPIAAADSFARYAGDLLDAEHQQQAEADAAHWLQVYRDGAPAVDLPTDRARRPQREFAAAREDMRLDPATLDAVKAFAASRGLSLFATLFAVYAGLLSRLSGQADLVVGISAAGQSAEGRPSLVGHCVNLLPIRCRIDGERAFTASLDAVRGDLLDALDHQSLTFGSLLQRLQLPRDPGRLPLVCALFNLDARIDPAVYAAVGLQAELQSNPRCAENFELYLNATPDARGLNLECQYKTGLFSRETVQAWLALYCAALQRLVAQPDAAAPALFAPTEAEQALLSRWNATDQPYPDADKTLDALLQRAAAEHAERVALVFEGSTLSYRELDARARALALALRARGAGPGTLVGISIDRSFALIVALLGVIYAGAAYVPLDPGLPTDRLAGMVEDARLSLLLSRGSERERLGTAIPAALPTLLLDELPATAAEALTPLATSDDPAYVIFTSGSTGRPKGAMNAHRGIVNRLLWMQQTYQLQPGERVLQKTPFSFDVSVWEFFWPLMTGATMVIARPDGHRDSAYIAELVQRERVEVMHFVPSMLRFFLDEPKAAACAQLRQVVCSGEALPLDLVERFFTLFPTTALGNLYGPTEAAVDVSMWPCRPHEPSGTVPIGAPIANTQLHVLDAQLNPLPIGVAGDLYIGGVQVGMGYVNRADLTAERFIADPFRAGGRLYKTGDIARWRRDGALEYLGRSDHQIKLRGYRIELGEIESQLLASPGVASATVVPLEEAPGDVRLAAYVVPRSPGLDLAALRDHLRARLPDYMVPSTLTALDRIPLLPSGKVDRRALPRPQPAGAAARGPRVAPATPLEATVLAAMEAVLKLPELSTTDDFFALGGHSLLAARLIARLNDTLDLNLPLRAVFEAPTAQRLAAAIERLQQSGPAGRIRIPHDPTRTAAPLTAQQERIAFVEELQPGRVTYNAPSAHRLRGPMNRGAFAHALTDVVAHQPILRTRIATLADGTHVQEVLPTIDVNLPIEDLRGIPAGERETELMRRMQAVVDQPIDIHAAPLWRAALYVLDEDEHAFLFMPHHIIWDGWSFDILYDDMAAAYAARARGAATSLPPLPVTYADYAAWQAQWIASEPYERKMRSLNSRLLQIEPPRPLGTDFPRRAGMSGSGATEWIRIDLATTERLREVARQADLTLNMLTLGLYGLLVADVAQSASSVIATPVRARLVSEVEPVMGFFNNLLLLRLTRQGDTPVLDFMRQVKSELLDGLNLQDVPFEHLALQPQLRERNARAGLYQALFSFQDARDRKRRWGSLQQSSILIFQNGATQDMGLWLMEVPQGLEGGVTYNADIYSAQTAQAFVARYLELVERLLRDPAQSVATLLDPSQSKAAAGLRHLAKQAGSSDVADKPVAAVAAPARANTAMQREVIAVWARVLNMPAEQIALSDNFFDLGGDSLSAMQAIAEMQSATGKRIAARSLIFESLEQIAALYDAAPVEPAAAAVPEQKAGLLGRLFGRRA